MDREETSMNHKQTFFGICYGTLTLLLALAILFRV